MCQVEDQYLELKKISKKYKLNLVEDAAEAFISKKKNKYLELLEI